MTMWTSDEITKATSGKCAQPFNKVNGISIDTRTLEKADLFVALYGDNGDGHIYVKEALEKGASGALVSKIPEGLAESDSLIIVTDTLTALQDMGVFSRERAQNAKRIGVTGSVGKTGTKEMLKCALSDQGRTTASLSSYNNHWGVPLSLARMPENTQFGVFEIGMNHPGEIRPLTKMVAPHVAIITTVAESHAAFFKSLEEIADAKAEIFEGLVPGGTAVINRDHPLYEYMYQKAKRTSVQNIVSFGEHKDANCRLLACELLESESHIDASLNGKIVSYVLPIPGKHWALNSLSVLLAVDLVGGDIIQASRSLLKMVPPKGRGTRHEIEFLQGKCLLIDESYNANPASMCAAIAVLGASLPQGQGRRIAIIGDMRELGDIADDRHADLYEPLMKAKIDQVYCCGPHMKKLAEKLPAQMLALHQDLSTQLIEPLLKNLRDGDIVMVKGSLGTRMAPIVEALKNQNHANLKAVG
ncbi:UDP-N-acetylmuramoyl-tripeptide--D-alanyl-D-alanine ligase [Candidatus Bealeia paramacronuclearis]|uniref:UDP-N-acetylmuramoyl-tripeptide--D-alanyl-D-alanine ligase n=1 Tax=Candidatus Bealeia paramacronuclearis TaxID=1921001 RepID=A0ABZ2C1D6_9PROT|nr:UDP-N-acetylmuramoyl-tripeptide--D-alanyl-D-alanine ligase [Candidatus Bealeia paramacronuclearis]